MGPKTKKAIADSQNAILEVLGHILTELRAQRITQNRICAKLELETEDRELGDNALGLRIVEHEREINRLKIASEAGGE